MTWPQTYLSLSLTALLLAQESCHAFVQRLPHTGAPTAFATKRPAYHRHLDSGLRAAELNLETQSEVERLREMAASLRSEAAQLEREQAEKFTNMTKDAFAKFDLNNNGVVSLEELQAGMKKLFKTDLSTKRVKSVFEDLDQNGDGVLQLEEFGTVDVLRNKLDAVTRQEKAETRAAAKLARQEKEGLEVLQAQIDLVNDGEPTNKDKLLSVLPYLFPLLDVLSFARFLVMNNPDNTAAQAIAILYSIYRSIPFGGFLAFFALSFLGTNPKLNKLVRFNMQQAVTLDVALVVPGLIAGLFSVVASSMGLELPPALAELSSDGVFLGMMAAIAYSSASSLLGQVPDKIPFISQYVKDRMISPDMFDENGQFIGRPLDQDDEESS